METDSADARRQLAELDDAVRTAESAALQPFPLWFAVLLGLIGPVIVGLIVSRSDQMARDYSATAVNLLWFGSLAVGLVICGGAAVALRIERRAPVRAKAPIRGGRTTPWNFASTASLVFGLMMTARIVPPIDENPQLVAIGSFLWLAIVPAFFWSKHMKAMAKG